MFRNINDLWIDAIEHLLYHSHESTSRVGNIKEDLAFTATLSNIDQTFLLNKRRKLSPAYGSAELLWYLMPTKSIEMIVAYAPQYIKFTDNDNRIAFGAYGYRIAKNTCLNQLNLIIEHLKAMPDSRQAIITMWNADDLYASVYDKHNDIPCTISLQFFIRFNSLSMITTMRSNDAWLGLPYDIFTFTCIQRLVANALNIPTGTYTHQVGSMHLYEKHWKAAEESLNIDRYYKAECNRIEHNWTPQDRRGNWTKDIIKAIEAEEAIRIKNQFNVVMPECEMLKDLVRCCRKKLLSGCVQPSPSSPMLQEAIRVKQI